MGTLVFQATLGGAVNIIGPNIAGTVNFTLPSADGSSGQALSTNGSGTLAFGTLAVAAGGTGVTTSTGSGNNVLSTSPTLVTPILGTPTSVTLTNGTGLPLTTGVTGTLPIANGGTGLTSTPANGALDIGNGTGFTRTTLTAGSNVTITNASGSITIAATGGGSSQWTTNGSDIYYNTGNVGIGTTAPTATGNKTLEINGAVGTDSAINLSVNGTRYGIHYAATTVVVSGSHASVPYALYTGNTERARIDTSGRLLVGLTSANTSGSNLQVSQGITFPATQSASTDANTLDDYEEGTWTPTVFGSTTSGTGTYSYQEGVYVKVGQMVTASAFISMSNNTGTGNIRFGGLPFTTVSTGTNRQAAAIGYLNNCSLTALNVPLVQAANNVTSLVMYQTPTGGGVASEVPMDTSFEIIFTFTYRCNA
jgi:hypothetical protein